MFQNTKYSPAIIAQLTEDSFGITTSHLVGKRAVLGLVLQFVTNIFLEINMNNDKISGASEFIYTQEMAILYNLGIGESEKLKHLYECDEQFSVLPTFFVLPSVKALIDHDVHNSELAKYKIPFDVIRLLHGEQFIEFYQPPKQNSGKLYTYKPHLIEVLDKGSATAVITETNTATADGSLLCKNQICCIIGNTGGWNGPRHPKSKDVANIVKPPDREPDKTFTEQTALNQAALYRLTGDRNPVHIDPIFAQAGGFDRPILHGLCTLGFAVRHVLASYEGNIVKRVKARFSSVIYPGETIVTQMWLEGKRVHFHCLTKETSKNLIVGAYVDFF